MEDGSKLEILDIRDCTIRVAKTKMLIKCAVIAQLTCVDLCFCIDKNPVFSCQTRIVKCFSLNQKFSGLLPFSFVIS